MSKSKGKLSDKYIAGFLDADGWISPTWQPTKHDQFDGTSNLRKPYICVGFSQLETHDEVIHLIRDALGKGCLSHYGKMTTFQLCGSRAASILQRIKKHLVIKRVQADAILSMIGRHWDVDEGKAFWAEARKQKSYPLPNYPSRKWLAGYLDGEGCFRISSLSRHGAAEIVMCVTASVDQSEGVELMKKAFGGSLQHTKKEPVDQLVYRLYLSPSKAKQVLTLFAKHMIVKQDQAMFILSMARNQGHYRDGIYITETLKKIRAHVHRLNAPKLDPGTLAKGAKDLSRSDFMYIAWEGRRAKLQSSIAPAAAGGC
jgi:hypothetical protein